MTTTITPSMNLPVPVPGEEPGPDWADDIVADMYAIDSHDHTTGKGVPITPEALDINDDLALNENNLTEVRTVRFDSQSAALSDPSDVGCLYEVSDDLYYNDGAGNQVRITQGGSVTGSSGTITGLPSGTASASFAGGTFTFQSATNTPASMNVGPLITGAASLNSKTVTISASGAQAANYDLTLPLALPASTSFASISAAGAMATVAATGTGNVVLATGATIDDATLTSASVVFDVGSAGAPSVTFTGDTDTGFYRISAGKVGLASDGVATMNFGSVIAGGDGDASVPGYTFNNDPDTGVFRHGTNAVGISTGGTERAYINNTGAYLPAGTVSNPGVSFTTDTDTGLYNPSANTVGLGVGGANVATFDSNGIFSAAGMSTSANDYIKWKVYSGTLTASSSVTLTPGGTVIGAVGTSQRSGTSARIPLAITAYDSPSIGIGMVNGTTTTVVLTNGDASNTNAYNVVVYYQ